MSHKYLCSACGKEHEEWPSLAFKAPDNYAVMSQADKESLAEISGDFCIIRHEEQTDRFIRCVMLQTVTDHCEALDYGLWVSLSEKSFLDYSENFNNENHCTEYFGWLCNAIPEYDFDKGIPTTVYTQPGNQRPVIVPHQDFDHPLVHDYYNGISKAEAERRIQAMIDSTGNESKTPPQSEGENGGGHSR